MQVRSGVGHVTTLGLEPLANPLHGLLEATPDGAVDALRDGGSDQRTGRLVGDPKLDPDSARDLGEREAALLLDQARLRDPADLFRAPPVVEPEHVAEGKPEGDHLDAVAGPHAFRLL